MVRKTAPQYDDAIKAFIGEKLDRMPGVEGIENAEIIGDVNEAGYTHDQEPDSGDRSEEFRHRSRTVRLDRE